MHRISRRIIFWIAVVLFLFGSYTIIKYAQGYRFEIQEMSFIKTGAILLKTFPKKSEVFINQKFVDTTSLISGEFTKRFLLPDTYSVEIKKSGKQLWRKQIQVKASEVSQFLSIYLPPESLDFKKSDSTEEYLTKSVSLNFITERYSFNSRDRRIYHLKENGQLEDIELDVQKVIDFSALPFSSQYRFWEVGFGKNNLTFVISKVSAKSESGVLFVLENGVWKLINGNVRSVFLSRDQKKIAILGKNEILIYWFEDELIPPNYYKGQLELIVRRSDSVSKLFWFDDEHLLFLSGGNVLLTEVDTRGTRNTYELAKGVDDFFYDRDGNLLVIKKDGETLMTNFD
ncbi:MAG: hypothetical protein HYW77_01750 [Parcubacteria group bacterium]|nr:hypothetical protein [Parcubacteria group bacterium]